MRTITKEARVKSVEARTPKVEYSCPEYTIRKIPLNYQVDVKIKVPKTDKNGTKMVKLIPDPFYPRLEDGLEEAKAMAERAISEAFKG